MSDDYPLPAYVESSAGGHVTVAVHSDGTRMLTTLMTSRSNGHPGALRLTADEVRRLITELEAGA